MDLPEKNEKKGVKRENPEKQKKMFCMTCKIYTRAYCKFPKVDDYTTIYCYRCFKETILYEPLINYDYN